MSVLRRATCDDVNGIAAVVYDVWQQDILTDVCEAQVHSETCALWVAEDEGDVAGFVSAFLTVGGSGVRRWEVDLLAVRRASQGRRLGRELVTVVCQDAARRGVSVARAAIHVDNIASQRAFGHAGFATDSRVHKLFLWPPKLGDGPDDVPSEWLIPKTNDVPSEWLIPKTNDVGNATLVPVDTVTYRGVWIEGLTSEGSGQREQQSVLRAARSLAASEGRATTGAVVPADEEHNLPADLREQARMHGEYYWFLKPVRPTGGAVERASVEDAAEILALQKLAYRSEAAIYGDYTIPPLVQTLEEIRADLKKRVFFKVSSGDRIVGSVRAHAGEGACFVGRLIVHPDWQNRGIGSRLMNEVEAAFGDVERFELFTGSRSEKNLYLYQKLGYEIFKREQLSDRVTLVFLEKRANQEW